MVKTVIVTTDKRGVFYGIMDEEASAKTLPKSVVLTDARMVVYWSADVKGVLGLAATGPTNGCRVTMAIPSITLFDITGVMECSDKAKDAMEAFVWKG